MPLYWGKKNISGVNASLFNNQESSGGIDTSDATATSNDIRKPKTAYVSTGKVIGTMLEYDAMTIEPSEEQQVINSGKFLSGDITVNGISPFYVGSSVTRQSAKTITPTKSSQTAVSANVYTTGAITVAPIPSQYITTTDANATASDILNGKTAYVNGVKITGNVVVQKYYSGSSTPSSSLGNNGDLYLKV